MPVSVLSSSSDIRAPQCCWPGRPGQLPSTGCRCSPGARGTPSRPALGDLAISELPKRLQRLGPVWQQRETRLFIPCHPDAAAPYQRRDPMGCDAHRWGNLRYRQGTRSPSWARSPVALQIGHAAGASVAPCWRAVPGAATSESLSPSVAAPSPHPLSPGFPDLKSGLRAGEHRSSRRGGRRCTAPPVR